MKKKSVLILVVLMIVLTLLAACNDKGNNVSIESSQDASEIDNSVAVNASGSISSVSNVSKNNNSATVSSIEPIKNETTIYLSVLGCTLTDNNCFVIVGKCEVGATITATTTGKQSVTATTDNGCYSVRFKKESKLTRVTIEAKGEITEKYVVDADPKIPTSDMWPIVGASGYNFFFQKMMPDFMQQNRLSNTQLTSLTTKIKSRVTALKDSSPDTEIIYMIVPSKASIYPELVPSDYKKGTSDSRLEQVNTALKAGGATVVDLLDVFSKHKDDENKLYWKTDSHWTDYGAYVAYDELFNYISNDFPAAAPRSFDDFTFKADYYNGGDMVYYMMMDQNIVKEYNYYRTPNFTMNSEITSVPRYKSSFYLMYNDAVVPAKTFNTKNSNLPDLYVMRDSYNTQMYDILADRGNTTIYKSMWDYTYNIKDINDNTPDYVIYIVAEWNIDSILKS